MAPTTDVDIEDFINRGVSTPGFMSVQFPCITNQGSGLSLGWNQQVFEGGFVRLDWLMDIETENRDGTQLLILQTIDYFNYINTYLLHQHIKKTLTIII